MGTGRYLLWCIGAALGFVTVCIALAVLVDPYCMYGTPTIADVTQIKSDAYRQVDLAKTRQLDRADANALVLGNSRSEIGIDPSSHF